MVLRHFIYLNNNLVADFYEELFEEKDDQTSKRKFNSIYKELLEQQEILFLNQAQIDLSEVPLHEIIETSGTLKIPKPYLDQLMLHEIMDSNLFGIAEAFQLVDHKEISKIERQGKQIQNMTKKDGPIPIVIPAKEEFNQIKILSNLEKSQIQLEVSELDEKEVFIIGKVIKKIEKRKKYKLYSMLPSIKENRAQRRKNKKGDGINNIQVEESGPALVIIPIAIYQ